MPDPEIAIGEFVLIMRRSWWKAGLVAIAAGLAALAATAALPNVYRATAVIAPAADEGKQAPFLGGALASFGIVVGGPTKVEDLESLFRSDDLAVRVFGKYDLWGAVYGGRYDPQTGMLAPGWTGRLAGDARRPKRPDDWDAIRAARDGLKVSVNKRAGTLVVSFDSRSAEGSARVVRHFLEEGKNRLQEEALARASRNKQFIGEQIARTVDPLTRDRLYTLHGQELEREMLAKNREQFGFRLIDSPRNPDRKIGPRRAQDAVLAAMVGFLAACGVFLVRGRKA